MPLLQLGRRREHILCMHDGSQKAPQSPACCCLCLLPSCMQHNAAQGIRHRLPATTKKLMMMKLQLQQRKLELLCASQLNDTLEGAVPGVGGGVGAALDSPPHPFCLARVAACLGGARIF